MKRKSDIFLYTLRRQKKKGKLGDDTFRIYFIFLRIMSFVLLKSETQKKTNSILLKSERVVQEEGKLFYRRNLII